MDTSSPHLILGLPLRLVAYSCPYNIFFGISVSCILSIWPSHLILWHLINLTMFSPLIMAYNSSFCRILHNSFSFTSPYIFSKFPFKILLMLFPLQWWVSMILNHRWPLDVPMCGISGACCFLKMRYGEKNILSTRKREKLWARSDIVMSNWIRSIFRKISRVPSTKDTTGQVPEEVETLHRNCIQALKGRLIWKT